MPNQSPIERRGLAGRASEVQKPAALLPIRPTGASAANCLVMLICVLLASAVQLRAQTGTGDSSKPEDEYHLGYDAGYQAGLRAAREKLAAEGGATGTPGNQPATTAKDSAASLAADAASSNVASRIKSLWDDMVNHGADDQDTVFHHSQTSPFWLSAQANFIAQMHPRFHAQYSGPNSLEHAEEQSVSRVVTVYTGFQFDDSTELILDAESSGWSGLSQGLGLAGFVDLDVVRNPQLSAEPYLARIWLRKVIRLSDENVEEERNPLSLLTTLPARRIDIHVGKVSLPD